MRTTTKWVASLATAAVLAPLVAVPAHASPRLELPRPTGFSAVGRHTEQLVDRTRADPWVPEAGPRRLMVTVFYPAVPGSGRQAAYLGQDEAAALTGYAEFGDELPGPVLASTRVWSREKAVPAPGRHPLVLLSPGYTVHRHTMTGLAEDLASHGYVVAAVDHAYEAVGVRFPAGVLPCAACDLPGRVGPLPVAANRAVDLRFVLDHLRHLPWVDRTRVAAVGHSMGGLATAAVMRLDPRVRAGVNLDGPLLPAEGVGDRPYLLLGTEDEHSPGSTQDPSWAAAWPALTGWKRWLTAAGADHFSFTDLDLLVQQAGLFPDLPLTGARGLELTRAYTRAFLDQHLRGRPRDLLTGPSPANPEIVFH
ncbi:alpha/beta hydrolase family protein [Actinokineospora spheciospongiae]|uniref:alpha/beta hydrolase family protein n=1 Tax=Actinokineospora spheciospongiae TaxID=909613 RepID=UPI00055965B3|nr:alpha/beta hydrolase [Actinokineospora spheciospongiae]